MKSQFLIFDCIFNDQELSLLNREKYNLSDMLINLHSLSIGNTKLLSTKLELTLLDMRELVNYKNARGYKWNSYILAMLILKLEYLVNILEPLKEQAAQDLFLKMLDSYTTLSELFEIKADKKEIEEEPEPIG